MKKVLTILAAQLMMLMPLVALAQGELKGISSLFNNFIGFINNTLIPLVFALALLMFFYGIFKYFILGGGDESSRAEGRQLMLWAIIGFVVMASIYGIVALISGGLGIDKTNKINVPVVPSRGNSG